MEINQKVTIERFLFWKYRVYTIDRDTRITYGLHLTDMGSSYQLQRKVITWFGPKWKKVAWASNLSVYDLQGLIAYLFWAEDINYKKTKLAF